MARPSLKAEKTEDILQAYERCIAKYGVEGATLQKVAEEADMARPLLRHYVGNQSQLLEQSVQRYFQRQRESIVQLQQVSSVKELLDVIFDAEYWSSNDEDAQAAASDIMIATAFTLAANQHAEIKLQMQQWFKLLQESLQQLLWEFFPDVNEALINVVSTGIIGIYFNLYAMQPIDNSQDFFEQSYLAASQLLSSLHQ